MGQAGQLDALERAVEGTLAEGSFEFDDAAAVLRIEGSPVLTTTWFLSCGVVGVALLMAGAVLSLAGLPDEARWALAPGAGLLGCALGIVLLLRFTPVAALWSDVELRFAERAMVHRRKRVPFGELRPEHLVWKNGWFFRRLYVRHPSLRKQLAGFFGSEERQAAEFRRRLWELIAAPELADAPGDGGLTPVQRWIIAAGAPYGAINGFLVDRLGTAPGESAKAADRRTAHELLQDPWGAYDLEQLLGAVNWLVQDGHRADFTRDARLAARPPAAQEEYGTLLREVDALIARDDLEPPFVERLIELVRLRYGDEGGSYARLVPRLLRDEPGADVSEEGAELAQFLHQLFNDRNHASEELHRLRVLADPALRANVERFLIWDYGRALMLYRWGHMVGWLTEEYCWERMLPLAIDIQRRYSSWRDMAACYLQGRLLWSGGGKAQAEYERLVENLLTEPRSPWNTLPWDLPLTRDWT
ncbi:DUF1266 domain-containing protein [Actinomadura livida]|uniref:DUF1266 domain-containing protein n=1 Tax=Actinomadura livida TaxID=79909 RepID=A0A7W7I9X4_9ACTN|nr:MULTISPECIES: DUF1266 domain-containing protein [Actinomadura]MBB4772818.1 hypothetical protein [Actinomadura catellatispora]GGU12933.1 hypothetical protein GCM10010208_42330 [Actinomadura livida]